MTYVGHVQNGVVVIDSPQPLPEGATVLVLLSEPAKSPKQGTPVQFPLVKTDAPGTVLLTDDRIAEIFEEEDLDSARR